MDRFIYFYHCLPKFQTVHLKSNMDRFISRTLLKEFQTKTNLKSNMDRFIFLGVKDLYIGYADLKSNMDRFICDC